MNWREQQWYQFDDSSCSKANTTRVVSDAAYNLFYRRRDAIQFGPNGEINYDLIKQTPEPPKTE
jgi:ubiquitin carboxyl-terminal hydrolase 4/11/15